MLPSPLRLCLTAAQHSGAHHTKKLRQAAGVLFDGECRYFALHVHNVPQLPARGGSIASAAGTGNVLPQKRYVRDC